MRTLSGEQPAGRCVGTTLVQTTECVNLACCPLEYFERNQSWRRLKHPMHPTHRATALDSRLSKPPSAASHVRVQSTCDRLELLQRGNIAVSETSATPATHKPHAGAVEAQAKERRVAGLFAGFGRLCARHHRLDVAADREGCGRGSPRKGALPGLRTDGVLKSQASYPHFLCRTSSL